jgi:hypothetical protein
MVAGLLQLTYKTEQQDQGLASPQRSAEGRGSLAIWFDTEMSLYGSFVECDEVMS